MDTGDPVRLHRESATEIRREPCFYRTVPNVNFRTLRGVGGANSGGFGHINGGSAANVELPE
jgi:hypothetical protein